MSKQINFRATKKGVASLYVVIFATILFGVITLSFIRIIISERIQSSNDDLSRSAYDSALAGVEDAKRAVMQCLKDHGGSISKCKAETELFDGDCTSQIATNNPGAKTFGLNNYLYGGTDTEVKIQENNTNGNNTDQAYTCVLLDNETEDYRSTLTTDTRTRVVPLGISSEQLAQVKTIKFSWFSELNAGDTKRNDLKLRNNYSLPDKSNASLVPTISLSLIKSNDGDSIKPVDYDANSKYQTTVTLVPGTAGNDVELVTALTQNDLEREANANNTHTPFLVDCDLPTDGFICSVKLTNLDLPSTAILVVSLPYGDTITDFAVTLYGDGEDEIIKFENVQIKVDSTGRANDLVRRVEARLDPADVFFPYPQYAVELNGDDNDSFSKNFWFTANCWTDQANCPNNNG